MSDWIHMLAILVAGGVLGLTALAIVGVWAMVVVIYSAGWAAAQHDHHTKNN